jgi:DNA polymerase
MPTDPAIRHRLLLSLRGEKAWGLKSIRRGTIEPAVEMDDEAEPEVQAMPPPRKSNPAIPPRAAAPAVPAPRESPRVVSLPTEAAFSAPLLSTEEKRARLAAMDEKEVRGCPKCRLCQTRTHTVFGEGDVDAKIFFIGEGPGENEDLTGRPFVGRAGQLLDKMIVAMGLQREQVFIANIVKCRPPGNRVPAPDEVAACTPYLERQLEIIRPRVIVTLGLPSAKYMLGDPKLTMGRIRGTWRSWRGIKLMPTFHPSYVLRIYTPETRKAVWSDLQQVMKEIGLSAPAGDRFGSKG